MRKPALYNIIYIHILILGFLISGITANAQSASAGGTINPNFGKNFGNTSQQTPGLLNKNNLHFSMQLGTSFSASGYGSALTTFVSPSISYRLSNKFTMQFGATIRNSFIDSRFSGFTIKNVGGYQWKLIIRMHYYNSTFLEVLGKVDFFIYIREF